MPSIQIRCDYEQVLQIGALFLAESVLIGEVNRKIKAAQQTLEGGDWIGKGATAFFQEMNNEVNPSMKRLEKALEEASSIVTQIHNVMHQAEEESSKILVTINVSSQPTGPGSGDFA
jgi:WXG100 family type VII secretion target